MPLQRQRSGQCPKKDSQIHPSPKVTDAYNGRHYVISNLDGHQLVNTAIGEREFVELPDAELLARIGSEELEIEDHLTALISSYSSVTEFGGLSQLLAGYFPQIRSEHFFEKVLPFIQKKCKQTYRILNTKIPILKKQENLMVTISQEQCCCILANAFMCTWPRDSTDKLSPINLTTLLSLASPHEFAKLACLINYFDRQRIREDEGFPHGCLTFERRAHGTTDTGVTYTMPDWENDDTILDLAKPATEIVGEGRAIEDEKDALQTVFAHKKYGGGVLGQGEHQEEVRFIGSPELICGCLFVEEFDDNEIMLITGSERFNGVSGYGTKMRYSGDYVSRTDIDLYLRRIRQILSMDAINLRTNNIPHKEQFSKQYVERDLNKVYLGCMMPKELEDSIGGIHLPRLCTGNWGCGEFGGERELKVLLQITAVQRAGRHINYMVYDDCDFKDKCNDMLKLLTSKLGPEVKAKSIYKLVADYYAAETELGFFEFIKSKYE